jgi:hypothetical protein
MADYSEVVTCPFCKRGGFDLIGLKNHIRLGWCDVEPRIPFQAFQSTTRPKDHSHG